MSREEPHLYRFGEFELEPGERRLSRQGAPVALTPKALDLLVYLVERAGHVVSKDELIEALWPRRIVIESNLTKHIWYLRKTLGEDENDAGLIQTVSKLGYRFAAPVIREGASDRTATAAPSRPIPPRRRWIALGGAGLVGAVAAGGLTLAVLNRDPPAGPRSGAAVALAGLRNLSRNPGDAWIGPALTEMLATDIALDGKTRALPDELVRPAQSDIELPLAGGFGRASLARLRRRLDADYVVTGGYLVSGGEGSGVVRIDFTVQDARTGATLATLSRSGAVSDLPNLATLAGGELRRDLEGPPAAGPVEVGPRPPTSDVMRHMGDGLDALHRYDAARARDEFLEAVSEAPGYAPAYANLAQAWSALGYKAKALAAAGQAEAHAAGLPLPVRLQNAIQSREAKFDWAGAVADLRQLVGLRPQDPEPRLQLIDALLSADKIKDAEAALSGLRALGGSIQGDPRLELAAANIAAKRDDSHGRVAHASLALIQARARDAVGLAAEAQAQLGIARASSDPKAAAADLEQARAAYRAVGNPRGEAWTLQNLGNVFLDSDPQRARSAYETSLAEYQRIGDESGAAADYSDLAIILWQSGDRDGAETAVRRVLDIRTRTEDLAGQAWALAALAVQQSDESASDEAIANFRRAIALDEAAEARGHLGFTLFSLSDDLRLRGDLAQAARTCALAQAAFNGGIGSVNRGPTDFECAQIALDIGDIPSALAGLERARAESPHDVMTQANVELTKGQIDMGLRRWPTALVHFVAAEKGYGDAEMATGQAVAASQAALAYAALGRSADRDREAARARDLRSRITERQEVIQVDMALAQLRGLSGDHAGAIAALNDLAADAATRRWLGWSLEAKLAAVQLGAGARPRADLAAAARKAGYGWLVKRLG
jgi:DNA-binding winged helix-turn-helix (wHTH) protein/tetratricopeptide (TPR) repeat protein